MHNFKPINITNNQPTVRIKSTKYDAEPNMQHDDDELMTVKTQILNLQSPVTAVNYSKVIVHLKF